jgi:hypothetical protein
LQVSGTPAPKAAVPAPRANAAAASVETRANPSDSPEKKVRTPRPSPAFAPAAPEPEADETAEERPRRNWLRWVLIVALVALIPVGVISWLPKKGTRAKGGKDTLELMSLPSWQKSPDSGLIFIKGGLTNYSDRPYFSVQIEFDLLNQNGTPVGTASDYVPVVDAHKVWYFKALVTDPDAKSFKLRPLKSER